MNSAGKLEKWVRVMHDGQLIRCTSEPYTNHLIFVAHTARQLTAFGYEIGLCHDLLEQTAVTDSSLFDALVSFDYSRTNAACIVGCVKELTNVFSVQAYPELGKKERRQREAARLLTISPAAQTVKYADLLYNIGWVCDFEKRKTKAVRYLLEKQRLLNAMDKGDSGLRTQALTMIIHSLQLFEKP